MTVPPAETLPGTQVCGEARLALRRSRSYGAGGSSWRALPGPLVCLWSGHPCEPAARGGGGRGSEQEVSDSWTQAPRSLWAQVTLCGQWEWGGPSKADPGGSGPRWAARLSPCDVSGCSRLPMTRFPHCPHHGWLEAVPRTGAGGGWGSEGGCWGAPLPPPGRQSGPPGPFKPSRPSSGRGRDYPACPGWTEVEPRLTSGTRPRGPRLRAFVCARPRPPPRTAPRVLNRAARRRPPSRGRGRHGAAAARVGPRSSPLRAQFPRLWHGCAR